MTCAKQNNIHKEKYIPEFTHYQKLHFRTPVTCKGGIIWHTIVRKTYRGYNFAEGIFLTVTPATASTRQISSLSHLSCLPAASLYRRNITYTQFKIALSLNFVVIVECTTFQKLCLFQAF